MRTRRQVWTLSLALVALAIGLSAWTCWRAIEHDWDDGLVRSPVIDAAHPTIPFQVQRQVWQLWAHLGLLAVWWVPLARWGRQHPGDAVLERQGRRFCNVLVALLLVLAAVNLCIMAGPGFRRQLYVAAPKEVP